MKSWKRKLGVAMSGLGKTLIGVGVVPQLSGVPNHALTWIAVAGFVIDAAGSFTSQLFAADADTLEVVKNQMREVPHAVSSGDTRFLRKAIDDEAKTP